MAKLRTPYEYTGRLGNATAYTMFGVPGVILRARGGPSRHAYEKAPSLARMRENSREFGGRARASGFIMQALTFVKPFADHNIAGPLNALVCKIQKATAGVRGKRGMRISKYSDALECFSLNRNVPFESVVRVPIAWSIDSADMKAEVTIPALKHGINFHPHPRHSMYRFVVSLGAVPDVMYSEEEKQYLPNAFDFAPAFVETEWCHVSKYTEETTIELAVNEVNLDYKGPLTLILAIGIGYGVPNEYGGFKWVKHAGAAKVLGVRAEG